MRRVPAPGAGYDPEALLEVGYRRFHSLRGVHAPGAGCDPKALLEVVYRRVYSLRGILCLERDMIRKLFLGQAIQTVITISPMGSFPANASCAWSRI